MKLYPPVASSASAQGGNIVVGWVRNKSGGSAAFRIAAFCRVARELMPADTARCALFVDNRCNVISERWSRMQPTAQIWFAGKTFYTSCKICGTWESRCVLQKNRGNNSAWRSVILQRFADAAVAAARPLNTSARSRNSHGRPAAAPDHYAHRRNSRFGASSTQPRRTVPKYRRCAKSRDGFVTRVFNSAWGPAGGLRRNTGLRGGSGDAEATAARPSPSAIFPVAMCVGYSITHADTNLMVTGMLPAFLRRRADDVSRQNSVPQRDGAPPPFRSLRTGQQNSGRCRSTRSPRSPAILRLRQLKYRVCAI